MDSICIFLIFPVGRRKRERALPTALILKQISSDFSFSGVIWDNLNIFLEMVVNNLNSSPGFQVSSECSLCQPRKSHPEQPLENSSGEQFVPMISCHFSFFPPPQFFNRSLFENVITRNSNPVRNSPQRNCREAVIKEFAVLWDKGCW